MPELFGPKCMECTLAFSDYTTIDIHSRIFFAFPMIMKFFGYPGKSVIFQSNFIQLRFILVQQRSMMTFDVCIVGAGIIGSALGYDLSRNNFSNVVLLDQVSISLYLTCTLTNIKLLEYLVHFLW